MQAGRVFSILSILLGASIPTGANPEAEATRPSNERCLECHADPTLKRADGGAMPVFSEEAYAASVHGKEEQDCVDCHEDLASAGTAPHAARLDAVRCDGCHEKQARLFAKSIHARSRVNGSEAAGCADCHGSHDIRPASDLRSRTNHFQLAATCGRCHGDAKLIERAQIRIGDTFHSFEDSIHGRALSRSGLVVAPNCADCHRAHDILEGDEASSPVHRKNVTATCGNCHLGVQAQYLEGVHGQAAASGNPKAPVCIDCHSAHQIQRVEGSSSRLSVVSECGSCHDDYIASYRDTFHGQVTALGFSRTATCSDCHQAHGIFAASDPRSSVSAANRVATCQRCHPEGNANFALYDPHVNPADRDRNPLIYWAGLFMNGLMISVFSFFGLHAVLWFLRELFEQRRGRLPRAVQGPPAAEAGGVEMSTHSPAAGERYLQRFRLVHRVLHAVLMVSFIGLALTGLPLLFGDQVWARTLARLFGGFEVAGLLHRLFALVMIAVFLAHLGHLARRLLVQRDRGILWGPSSMVPQPRDLRDLLAHLRWFVTGGQRPRFDRYTYWEKFDYWAVFWGMAIIGGSGLFLWFPELFARLFPGWVFNLALLVHSDEALLAVGFIFTIHFFNSHVRPARFPMDVSIFTGRITESEMKHERPDEHARLVAEGRLESLVTQAPSELLWSTSRTIGTVAILLGLLMVGLILFAWLT